MVCKQIIINNKKGLHARIVAAIIHRANDIQEKYDAKVYIKYKDKNRVSATSLMPLVNLKVKNMDKITIEVEGAKENTALNEMLDFFKGDFRLPDCNTINEIDNIIDDNVITVDQVFQNIASGIIVIDRNDNIIIFNSFAEKVLKMRSSEVIGKKINNVIPSSRLSVVNNTGKSELMSKMIVGKNVLLINETPVIIDGDIRGAIEIFQDISNLENVRSQLRRVRELEKKFQLILQSLQEGICVVDENGKIAYVNDTYINMLHIKKKDILGKDIKEVSCDNYIYKVLQAKKSINNVISKKNKGITIVSNINPVIVNNQVVGAVSVVKNLKEVQSLTEKLNKVSAKAEYLEEELMRTKEPEKVFSKFIGKSGKVIDALATALKAAKSDATILIRGESGTGKELIADGIHYASAKCRGPFIRVNCAAIPTNLLESELFGYEKGAFTGAIKRRLGKFELAQHGTIFLDEIGEMEMNMQAKILRAIQEREIQRIGGEETIKIDARIIAATNRNLEEMVKEGEFREDLYYRLNVIPIFLPPLRERKQDIGLLVEHFMKKLQKSRNKNILGITNEAMEALLAYRWPGNVRELENIFERLFALIDGDCITLNDLPPYIRASKLNNKDEVSGSIIKSDEILTMEEYEKLIIQKALEKYGSYNRAGKVLGINHKTVAAKARKYGIEKIVAWEKTPGA